VLTGPAGRRVVIVSGPPAAGKSTIAGPLAAELGFTLIAKDRIKETLHDALGSAAEADLAWSQRLGATAMELLWTLAQDAPAVVLEANFWSGDARVEERTRAELGAGRGALSVPARRMHTPVHRAGAVPASGPCRECPDDGGGGVREIRPAVGTGSGHHRRHDAAGGHSSGGG
jgi:hypothetical protein